MQDRLSSSLEDYLKTIYNLCQKDNQTNANKIAQVLDVKKSSVSWALKQLADKQLINYLPYLPISLTKHGLQEAIKINARHEAIKEYLIGTLNIDPEIAQANACRMEHVIDPDILDKMVAGTKKGDSVGSGLPLPKESGQKERDIPCRVIEILSECNVTLQDWQKSVIRVFMNSDLHQSIDGLTKNCLVYKSDIDQDDVQGVMDILCEHRFAEPLYVDGRVVYEHHHPESHHD
ncbi:MAG: metal-dependent transcriptional regulator, partial [Sedimentisphaerales bacterium]|nr:metal-dependent transcriptional regulator [Sedimentisphaerales bacterium]